MRFYTDGLLRDTQTSTQTGSNLDLLVSDSLVGAAKRDNNRYFRGAMDEVWVFDVALEGGHVLSLKENNEIPEPSSVWLTTLAIGGALAGRRRRNC